MDNKGKIELLGWLYMIWGGLVVVGGVLGGLGAFMGGIFSGDLGTMITSPLAAVIIVLVVGILGVPSLLIGWGLLNRRGWARVLALVVGALNFFSFPLGTALCVFTFWVLWGKDSDPYFERYYPSHHQ